MSRTGRPPLDGVSRRTRLTVRLSDEEMRWLRTKAGKRGISVSELVRGFLKSAGLIPPKLTRKEEP